MELLQTSEYDNTSTDMRMDKVPDALRDEELLPDGIKRRQDLEDLEKARGVRIFLSPDEAVDHPWIVLKGAGAEDDRRRRERR